MELVLLGTGCPVVSTERFGPAALVIHDGAHVLIDCGSGVTQRLVGAGISGRDLDAVLLTHLHTDHLIDLYQLIVSSWHQGRDRPQVIYGPPGTQAYVDGVMALWETERKQRIAHEMRPSVAALDVKVTEITDGWALQLGNLAIGGFAVDHRPVRHAFGFSFEGGGKRLVISGDTRPCTALELAAKGADVLLNEVFVHREMPIIEGVRSQQTVDNVGAYHTASSEVGKMAGRVDVNTLVLTHFVPPNCDREKLLAEVGTDFKGQIIIGEDLMRFDLASGRIRAGNMVLRMQSQ